MEEIGNMEEHMVGIKQENGNSKKELKMLEIKTLQQKWRMHLVGSLVFWKGVWALASSTRNLQNIRILKTWDRIAKNRGAVPRAVACA